MALGATGREVLMLVARQGVVLVVVGVGIGLVGATIVTRYLETMLFGLTPLDPITFVGVAMIFTLTATAACGIPSVRACRVDPLVSLRYE